MSADPATGKHKASPLPSPQAKRLNLQPSPAMLTLAPLSQRNPPPPILTLLGLSFLNKIASSSAAGSIELPSIDNPMHRTQLLELARANVKSPPVTISTFLSNGASNEVRHVLDVPWASAISWLVTSVKLSGVDLGPKKHKATNAVAYTMRLGLEDQLRRGAAGSEWISYNGFQVSQIVQEEKRGPVSVVKVTGVAQDDFVRDVPVEPPLTGAQAVVAKHSDAGLARVDSPSRLAPPETKATSEPVSDFDISDSELEGFLDFTPHAQRPGRRSSPPTSSLGLSRPPARPNKEPASPSSESANSCLFTKMTFSATAEPYPTSTPAGVIKLAPDTDVEVGLSPVSLAKVHFPFTYMDDDEENVGHDCKAVNETLGREENKESHQQGVGSVRSKGRVLSLSSRLGLSASTHESEGEEGDGSSASGESDVEDHGQWEETGNAGGE